MKVFLNVKTGDAGYLDDIVVLDIPLDGYDDFTDFVSDLPVLKRYSFAYLFGKVANVD